MVGHVSSMESKNVFKALVMVIVASLILAFSISYAQNEFLLYSFVSFLIIISGTMLVKKVVGYLLEIDVETKFWSVYQYGFKRNAHFKRPIPFLWLPLLVSLVTQGVVWWFAILSFDVTPRTERTSRRHGLYRFTQVTEWHIAWIAVWGVITSITLSIIGYIAGFEFFSELSIYYALWSLVPISNLDGSKIFFSSRGLWFTVTSIVAIIFVWSQIVI